MSGQNKYLIIPLIKSIYSLKIKGSNILWNYPCYFPNITKYNMVLQTVSINVGFRLEAITGSLIASIPEELLYRYLVFALCVILCNNQIRTKKSKVSLLFNFNCTSCFNALSSRSGYILY